MKAYRLIWISPLMSPTRSLLFCLALLGSACSSVSVPSRDPAKGGASTESLTGHHDETPSLVAPTDSRTTSLVPWTSEQVEGTEHASRSAEEGEALEGDSAFLLFVGGVHKEEWDFSFGLEYEYRIHERWTLGMAFEDTPSKREPVFLLPRTTYNLTSDLWLVLALGVEYEESAKLLARTGLAWELELEGPFQLAIEANYDFVQDAADAVIVGVTFGYAF